MPKPKVLYFFRGNRAGLSAEVSSGEAPDDFLYGMNHFPNFGFDVEFVEAAPGDGEVLRACLRPLERLVGAVLGRSFTLSNAIIHREKISSADICLTTTDGNLLPLLALKRLGILKKPIMGITQGLFEFEDGHRSTLGRGLARHILGSLLGSASRLVVLGQGDLQALKRCFGRYLLPPVVDVQFGVDTNFWSPADVPSSDTPLVLSVGSDRFRDYDTLFQALPNHRVRIVTKLKIPIGVAGRNVEINGNVDYSGLRDLYRQAACVVVPIKDQGRDSGHSVTLQAMACGRPVVLSETAGLWDREHFVDGKTVYLVPPGDPGALARKVEHVLAHPDESRHVGIAARKLVEARYSSRIFASSMANLSREIFNEKSDIL